MDNITAFNNHLPVKVRFGEGVAETLPAVVAELRASKVFLMVDKDIEKFNPAAAKYLATIVSPVVVRLAALGTWLTPRGKNR